MNILGMGTLEILLVLLLAFILLGPQRMVDAARLLGKASREIRRMTENLPALVLDETQAEPSEKPVTHGVRSPRPRSQGASGEEGGTSVSTSDDGPVAPRSGATTAKPDESEPPKQEEP